MAKDVTVCLSFDFDAMSVWIANFRTQSPNALSRGEFGRVGALRLLDLLAERELPATWFIPGHTIEAFPAVCERIVDAGHEVGHHGYCHENPRRQEPETEQAILERGIELIRKLSGRAPLGYRSPAGSFSTQTIRLLTQHGFVYDSSMMADDFTPYYCRDGVEAPIDAPYRFGEVVDLVELPFSWNLDDFPAFEYTASRLGVSPGLADPERVYSIWSGEFEYLYNKLGAGVFVLTLHPQTIGRGHRLLMLERLLDDFQSHAGVRFRMMGEYAAAWRAANPLAEWPPVSEA
jgi:peptidoglycan/xylan/chitin deacetylase (PgdA/CDA1 family)